MGLGEGEVPTAMDNAGWKYVNGSWQNSGENQTVYFGSNVVLSEPRQYWELDGNGNATAMAGATLWGLAKLVSDEGMNYSGLTGYEGAYGDLPIGTIINYSELMTEIGADFANVKGSGFDNSIAGEMVKNSNIIFNSQGIAALFQLNSITEIEQLSTSGFDLLNGIGVSDIPQTNWSNLGNINAKGINGEIIPLMRMPGENFITILTSVINDVDNPGKTPAGFGFYDYPISILAYSNPFDNSTAGHEFGHNMTLEHYVNNNNIQYNSYNLMGYDRLMNTLTRNQIQKINDYLQRFYRGN